MTFTVRYLMYYAVSLYESQLSMSSWRFDIVSFTSSHSFCRPRFILTYYTSVCTSLVQCLKLTHLDIVFLSEEGPMSMSKIHLDIERLSHPIPTRKSLPLSGSRLFNFR